MKEWGLEVTEHHYKAQAILVKNDNKLDKVNPGVWQQSVQSGHSGIDWKSGGGVQPVQGKIDWTGSSFMSHGSSICLLPVAECGKEFWYNLDKECII